MVRRSWRLVLVSVLVLGLAGCAAKFAPSEAQEIEPPDNVSYCGSDASWHYFFHAMLVQSATYKISRAVLQMEAEHPVTSQADCVLAAGHFETTPTGTWFYEPSAKQPPVSRFQRMSGP